MSAPLNRRNPDEPPVMAGYLRTSTEDQKNGLEAQRDQIRHHAAGRAISVQWFEEHASAKDLERPELARALEALADGQLDGLIVAKLDRLSRSLHDLTGLFRVALEQDWALVSLAPAVDMTSPYGRAMAQMAGVFSELERELISMRTREALAQLDLRLMDKETLGLVVEMSARGMNNQAVADELEKRGIPNPSGGRRWHRSTVWRAIQREFGAREQRRGPTPRSEMDFTGRELRSGLANQAGNGSEPDRVLRQLYPWLKRGECPARGDHVLSVFEDNLCVECGFPVFEK